MQSPRSVARSERPEHHRSMKERSRTPGYRRVAVSPLNGCESPPSDKNQASEKFGGGLGKVCLPPWKSSISCRRQHPVAYKSRKLTATERNYPAHILELLAVVHALRIFKHYLLGSGAPRPDGCGSDFDLRTDRADPASSKNPELSELKKFAFPPQILQVQMI